MKPSLVAILIAALLFLVCCKKKDERQFSYWYVNSDSFLTNDIRVDAGMSRKEMLTNNFREGFQIIFNGPDFPVSGSYKLDCSTQNPLWTCFGILHNDTGYLANPLQNNHVTAYSNNGKAQYVLVPTWFYNSYRTSDSILVHGTFNEP